MTVQAMSWVIHGQSHSGEVARAAFGAAFGQPVATHTPAASVTTAGGAHGVVEAGALAVSQNGTPNMSVNVAAGSAIIRAGHTGNITGGAYALLNDATLNVSIAAADSTNPRIDYVIAQVRDSNYGEAAAAPRITVITGTPAASPSAPSLTSYPNVLVLASVAVAAAATTITNANITDLRTRAHALGGIWVGTSSQRPSGASLYEGKLAIDTTNDRLVIVDASNVEKRIAAYSATGRTLVRARRVATQSIPNNTSTDISWDTEDSDVDGLIATPGATFTIPSGLDGMWTINFRGGFASTIAGARAFVDCTVVAAATGVSGSWRANMYGDSSGNLSAGPIPLAAGDTFKFTAFQLSGGAVNLTGWMTAVRIGC